MIVRKIARPLLASAFVGQGIETLTVVAPGVPMDRPTVDALGELPAPVVNRLPADLATVARINAASQIVGGVLLASGRAPRIASAVLALTVLPANLGQHMFWNETDPIRRAEKRRGFLSDLSLIGGLVLAAADTAGKPSLAWRGRRAARRLTENVSAAIPSVIGSAEESTVVDKLSESLQSGWDRSRELAEAAIERSAPIAEAAYHRAGDIAHTARDQGEVQLAASVRKLRDRVT
jgi:uncharacterized membrane protein YphA (DoxX/SURF4 family)